jgi:hypothetical protein
MRWWCAVVLAVVHACKPVQNYVQPPEPEMVGEQIVDVFEMTGPQHGVSNGLMAPPPRMAVVGELPTGLAGSWSDDTSMSWRTLAIDAEGHFLWTMHGCMGTTYWVGDARRHDNMLVLVPYKPDWMFGGGRVLDIREGTEGTELVPRPRSKDDRSSEYPLRRSSGE